ncbi:hypothetical protein L1987_08446 [Smallanthus sonchifolius]|uniref:Uncharacterized protein n=1 Tax=Smallanthus sonchifolius TaxID=185202 RepID=A0ACB9JMY0_9ASTR|nr:hypothetical protein L1987_08446 [Smallanthus sonchifolius]
MNEWCSTVIEPSLPQKMKDPGSFTIPCVIGGLSVGNALADLGARINLMPYSVFKKLGLGEPQPTRMSLQLTDRPVKYPRDFVGNMLVRVYKFIFPVDFVILDMDEDEHVPLILGRPFLAIAHAMIDVFSGKLTLGVNDEKVVPKKGGMTNVVNEKNELIPMRTVTGWRVCIDYMRLNDATRKDHFPLSFIDQMLERLMG